MIVYKGRLLKNPLKSKLKLVLSTLVVFKQSILFATHLAANYGCYLFRIMQDIVSKLLDRCFGHSHLKTENVLLFYLNLSSFLERLLVSICCLAQNSIQNMLFYSYVLFLLRDQCMIERLSIERLSKAIN